MNYFAQSPDNIFVAAHRGSRIKYAENTIPAFAWAISLGVDQIEFDVRVSKDGELVIIHDDTVDRTTNGKGRVCELTLNELKSLDASAGLDEQKGVRIPTLIEVMELVKDHPTITLDVELKEYPTQGKEELAYSVCDRVLGIIDDYGFTDRVVVNTFSGKLHQYIREKYGAKYRQHVYFPIANHGSGFTLDPYSYGYCCCMFKAFSSEINMALKCEFDHMLSLGVQPWAGAAVRDERGVDMAIECGAYLITCDNPDEILDLLRKKGKHK